MIQTLKQLILLRYRAAAELCLAFHSFVIFGCLAPDLCEVFKTVLISHARACAHPGRAVRQSDWSQVLGSDLRRARHFASHCTIRYQ